MKKIFSVIVCLAILVSITGCTNQNQKVNEIVASNIEGIKVIIQDNTLSPEGVTLIIKDETEEKYTFGEDFYIERNNDGNWERVEPISDSYAFNSIGYYAFEKELELKQNWDYIYGKLDNGRYRLVKSTFKESDIPITKEDLKYIYVEFEIK